MSQSPPSTWPVAHLQLLFSSQLWKSLLCSVEPVFVGGFWSVWILPCGAHRCGRCGSHSEGATHGSNVGWVCMDRCSQNSHWDKLSDSCQNTDKRIVGTLGFDSEMSANSEQSLEAKFGGICLPAVGLLCVWGGGGGNSPSCFCRCASSFDQAYRGKVALGGTVTPTQQGGTEGCIWKQFFSLLVLSVMQMVLRVLNNN